MYNQKCFNSATLTRLFFDFVVIQTSMLLVLPYCTVAQTVVNYGRGPTLGYNNPSLGSDVLKIESGSECPMPSFGLGAYGGGGNDWADQNLAPYPSSSSGINNYGVTVGLRVPLGAEEISKACKAWIKAKSVFARINLDNAIRNSQLSLLRQCYWLHENYIKVEKLGPEFSSLSACSGINFSDRNQGYAERNWAKTEGGLKGKPELSPVVQPAIQSLQVNTSR
jgi:hypothetical protein